jgi:hypothetical protein
LQNAWEQQYPEETSSVHVVRGKGVGVPQVTDFLLKNTSRSSFEVELVRKIIAWLHGIHSTKHN